MIRRTLTLVAAAALAGCAHYQLGSTLPPDARSIYVPVFVNKTNEPDVDQEATRAAITEFQNDGTLRVLAEGGADLVLEATVHTFELKPLRYDRGRATTTEEFRMTLIADVIVRKADGKIFLDLKDLVGESTFPVGGDMRAAKSEALPKAAKDLAHRIVENVVEGW